MNVVLSLIELLWRVYYSAPAMVAGFLGPEVLPVSKWLNTIGLVFGVVGVVLIFI